MVPFFNVVISEAGDITIREEAKQNIAQLLQNYLTEYGHSIGWLAGQLGVHRNTLSRILHQKVLPDAITCRALAEVMGLPPEKLLTMALYLPNSPFSTPTLDEAQDRASSLRVPELNDPELGFYLSQIGKMPEKTRTIIKTILREEYYQIEKERIEGRLKGDADAAPPSRPPFARKGWLTELKDSSN